MGTAGCGYYFVNGPHAAEREGPPGDDHSDIRVSVTWKKRAIKALSSRSPTCVQYLCRSYLRAGNCRRLFRDSAQDGCIQIREMFVLILSMSFVKLLPRCGANYNRISRKSVSAISIHPVRRLLAL